MDTNDYITQCTKILSDNTTYRLASEYPIAEIRTQLTNTLIAFKPHLENFNKRLYSYLHNIPQNYRIPQFYGIPKMHKEYTQLPPMRPIVSQTLSPLTATAKYIDHALQPLAQTYPDYLHNSSALSLLLDDLHVPDEALLVSIDVVSLYPSIPQSDCLNVIYTEMNTHSDLLAVEPNMLIHLLHIAVNFNYFSFAGLKFQQIKGTAMGTAFSPTIANIYMSSFLKRFLQTQSTKPLLLTRYIDDMFMIWTGSRESLTTFITELNLFNSNLSFTHEISDTTINFLDLIIHKGPSFPFTNILDTKTYTKPQNLYQYLHFNSAHPPKIFKALIKGECIRYVRTNTTYDSFRAAAHLLKLRLRKRSYPVQLIDKVTSTVSYSNRKHYLTHSQPKHPTCLPPIFKCTPPPNYDLLKELVLKNYNKLHFTSPRFVTLRHPTLRNFLVRAKLHPTDEQFIDLALQFENQQTSPHIETAVLPKLKNTTATVTQCKQINCSLCPQHLLTKSTFSTSKKPHTTYRIRHNFSCSSKNLIYLITCNKCKKQYVGYTTKELRTRINHHRSNIRTNQQIYISKHFNLQNHTIADMIVQPIDQANNTTELHKLEQFWINTLHTLVPFGLNVSPGISS